MLIYITLPFVIYNKITFPIWYPCDQANNQCYWIVNCHKIAGLVLNAYMHAIHDIFLITLIHNISLQINLLGHRFVRIFTEDSNETFKMKISKEEEDKIKILKLRECIKDHQHILL